MTDLQCPVKVLLVAQDLLGPGTRVETLPCAPYSGVFGASSIAADASGLAAATDLAQQVSCPLDILADAVDGASLARAIEDLSDVYRGETIIVVAPRDLLRALLGRASESMKPVTVAIDSDGWVVDASLDLAPR
jgi:hypothetical protein